MTQDCVLIIGGSGKTGGRVAAGLQARGIATRLAARSTPIPFDWTRPEGWAASMHGVSRAYVTYQPDLAVEGAAEDIARWSALARAQGLKQAVLLSGRGEPGAERAEAALQASGLPFTIIRSSWFCQNFSEGPFLGGILAGELALPAGPVPEPFIDVDDIAEIAVAALTDPRHLGELYEVTGPRALTFAQAMAEIARATGRDVKFQQVPVDAFLSAMPPEVPAEVTDLLIDLFKVVLDGRNAAPRDGVMRALGRPARDFADYAERVAATGIWAAP